jgi:hypothetical protein
MESITFKGKNRNSQRVRMFRRDPENLFYKQRWIKNPADKIPVVFAIANAVDQIASFLAAEANPGLAEVDGLFLP